MSTGADAIGAPWGKKREKNLSPWVIKPIIVTPMKMNADIANVTARWLVNVNAPGIKPSKFPNKININKEKMKGK